MKQILALFVLSLVVTASVQAEPVRIGVLTDLSAGMASWGQQTRLGGEIAADKIRKSGKEVQLTFGDHQLQAKNAISEFRKLTELNRVDAIYSEFTPTTIAIAPLSKSKHVPVIYAAAAASPLTSSPYMFKSYLDYVAGCNAVGKYFKSRGVATVGILKASWHHGQELVQSARSDFQG